MRRLDLGNDRSISTLARRVRVAGAIAAEAAAVAFAIGFVSLGSGMRAAVETNAVAAPVRTALLVAVVVTGAIAGTLALALDVWLGDRRTMERIAKASALLVPLGFVPPLLVASAWTGRPFQFVVLLAMLVLFVERLARPSLEILRETGRPALLLLRQRVPAWSALALVVAAALAYAVYTGYVSVLNHRRFGTGAFDLAIFDNMMWNGVHGHPFRSTVMYGTRGGNAIADHAHYAEVLFLPLYALWPRADMLLILQAVMLGFAAIPLFLFAKTQLARPVALLVALAYLLYAPLHGAQFYDFHWLPLAVFFLFWLFYSLAARRNWITFASVLVLFALREDVAPGIAVLGLFLFMIDFRPRVGLTLAASAMIWTLVNKFVLMPLAGPSWFIRMYDTFVPEGEHGFFAVVKTLATNPVYAASTMVQLPKLEYVGHMLAPVAFLPTRRVWILPLIAPGVLFTVLTNWGPAYSVRYQYTTHWVPYVFGAVVLALAAIERESGALKRNAACFALAVGVLVHSTVFGVIFVPGSFVSGPVKPSLSMTDEEAFRYAELRRLIDLIPPNVSVSSTDIEAPHVSNRADVYAVAQDASAGEYVLVSLDSLHQVRTRQNLTTIFSSASYGLVADSYRGRFLLFQRGKASPRTDNAFRRIGIAVPTRP
jgi:uncharacterized membrane protein